MKPLSSNKHQTNMARVKNFDQITGSIGKFSFYTRKGSSGILVRTKGGASKEKIASDPNFANLRKSNKEFGGCAKMSKQMRMAFYGLEHVAEFNLAPALSKIAKDIQKTDTTNLVGERSFLLSKYRFLLAGFDFSRTTRFNSLLRVPLSYNIDRERQQASLQIPAFACSFGLNLTQYSAYGLFRITAALGIVTDMVLNPANQTYEPVHDKLGQGFQTRSTPWYSTQTIVPAQELTFSLTNEKLNPPIFNEADSLVLTVIVEFGTPDALGNTMPVRGSGGGMVLGVE